MGLNKSFEKIISIIFDVLIVILGLILVVSIYNGIQIKILGNKYSNFFGYTTFEVQTGSMSDTINPGDWIIVKLTDDVKLKDIITYQLDNEFITHRVVEVYKNYYVTKGDANPSKDDEITKKQIVGKVVKTLPKFGFWRKTLFNPYVLGSLIVTIYLISQLFNKDKKNKFLNKFKRKTKEKNQDNLSKENETISIEKIDNNLPSEEINVSNIEVNELFSDDDLDKTICFRVINVEKDEIDKTILETAENKIENVEEEIVVKTPRIQDVEEDDEETIKSNLEILQKSKPRKFNNIIDKIIYLKEDQLEEIISIIDLNDNSETNEATIKKEMLQLYIDAKYYNHCGNVNVNYNNRNMIKKLTEEISLFGDKLINNYQGKDKQYSHKVKKYEKLFCLLINIEHANDIYLDKYELEEFIYNKLSKFYLKEKLSNKQLDSLTKEIIRVTNNYKKMINYSLKKLESNSFQLRYNQLLCLKNRFAIELSHNLSFSRVYSDFIVDKTYSEGIVAEDKVIVLTTLLMNEIAKNMMENISKREYVINVPDSLFTKENKLKKLLKIIDDEYVKNNIYLLIKYSALKQNSKIITMLRKEGFRFILAIDHQVKLKKEDEKLFVLCDYIFIDKNIIDESSVLEHIPMELKTKIYYEDILSKTGDYKGE